MEPGTFTEEEINRIKEELKSLGGRKTALTQEMNRLRPFCKLYDEIRQWEDKLMETAAMLSREKEGTKKYKDGVDQRIRILLYQERLRSQLPKDAVEKEIRSLYLKTEEEYWTVDHQMDECRRSLIEDCKAKRKAGLC